MGNALESISNISVDYIRAIEENDVQSIRDMLNDVNVDIYSKDEHGNTFLILAARENREEVVKMLLEKSSYFFMNLANDDSDSALSIACRLGYKDIVYALLCFNCLIDTVNKNGETPLTLAFKYPDIVQLLTLKHADTNIMANSGETALTKSAYFGCYDTVKILVDSVVDIDIRNRYGSTALTLAAQNGYMNICKLLVDRGANINMQNNYGETALMLAVDGLHIDIVLYLLNHSATVDAQDIYGTTALTKAILSRNLEVIKLMLDHPTCSMAPRYLNHLNKRIAIHEFCAFQVFFEDDDVLLSVQILKELIAAYPEGVEVQALDDYLPLHYAVSNNAPLDIVKVLVNTFPESLKMTTTNGEFPLHLAAHNHASTDVIKFIYLLYPDAIQIPNTFTRLPIHDFCANQLLSKFSMLQEDIEISVNTLKTLYNAFPDGVYQSTKNDYLALHYAIVSHAPVDIINELLLLYPESVQCKTLLNELPILLAIKHQVSFNVVELLISRYPECILEELDGNTLLNIAINSNSSVNIVKVLVFADLPVGMNKETNEYEMKQVYGESWFILLNSSVTPAVYSIPIVKAIIQTFPITYVRRMFRLKDIYNREAIHIITNIDLKRIVYDSILFCGKYEVNEEIYPLYKSPTSVLVRVRDYSLLSLYGDIYNKSISIHNESLTNNEIVDSDELLVSSNDNCAPLNEVDEGRIMISVSKSNDSNDVKPVSHMTYELFKESILLLNSLFEHDKKPINVENCDLKCDENDGVSVNQFIEFCLVNFGEYRNVMLKFTSKKAQFEKEIWLRGEKSLDSTYVIELLEVPNQSRYHADIKSQVIQGVELNRYDYCLVLSDADRNLDQIYRHENLSIHESLIYAENIVDCLLYLHEKGLIFNNLKLSNVLRFNANKRLVLSNLESCVAYNDSVDSDNSIDNRQNQHYIGSLPFTSGLLPPEMFHNLDSIDNDEYNEDLAVSSDPVAVKRQKRANYNQYIKYWYSEYSKHLNDDIHTDVFIKRLKPIKTETGNYIVKSFNVDSSGNARNIEKLPYSLIVSNTKIDSWSFGLLLYELITNKPFIQVNKDSDIDDESTIEWLSSLSLSEEPQSPKSPNQSFKLSTNQVNRRINKEIIDKLRSPILAEFLKQLLNPDPSERIDLTLARGILRTINSGVIQLFVDDVQKPFIIDPDLDIHVDGAIVEEISHIAVDDSSRDEEGPVVSDDLINLEDSLVEDHIVSEVDDIIANEEVDNSFIHEMIDRIIAINEITSELVNETVVASITETITSLLDEDERIKAINAENIEDIYVNEDTIRKQPKFIELMYRPEKSDCYGMYWDFDANKRVYIETLDELRDWLVNRINKRQFYHFETIKSQLIDERTKEVYLNEKYCHLTVFKSNNPMVNPKIDPIAYQFGYNDSGFAILLKDYCLSCKKDDCPLFHCSRCFLMRYCSKQCQANDYPVHKFVCILSKKSLDMHKITPQLR